MQSSIWRESTKVLDTVLVKYSWTRETWASLRRWRLTTSLCNKAKEISSLKAPTLHWRCALQVALTTRESTGIASTGAHDLTKGRPPYPLRTRGKSSWTWWQSIRVASIIDSLSLNCKVPCAANLHSPPSIAPSSVIPRPREPQFPPFRRSWSLT